ncbi:MAG TPA: rRNA maturation RNase YbeY [Blastocatellia bacterium]|nr:rRNA maturation RNase YbeY [Blastocatellia bacterium]
MAIEVVNRQRLVEIDQPVLAILVSKALAALCARTGLQPEAWAAVALVRDSAIRRLNRDYRGKDAATDVLSFPAEESHSPGEDGYLGDIVISTDTAKRQASQIGHSVQREIAELAIHGVLHLCGYDHETDKGEMDRIELRLRKKLLD